MYFYWFAVQRLSVSLVAVIHYLVPFATMIVQYLFLKERSKPVEILNMVVSMAGIFMIISNNLSRDLSSDSERPNQVNNADPLSLTLAFV